MNNNAVDTKLYDHEVGRYKRKVELLEKELERKREEIEGWKQSHKILQSMADLIVEAVGEVVIYKEALYEALAEEYTKTEARYDPETMTYTLRHIERPQEDETE